MFELKRLISVLVEEFSDVHARFNVIEDHLDAIRRQGEKNMAVAKNVQDQLDRIGASLGKVAADTQTVKDKIAQLTSAADTTETEAAVKAVADQVEAAVLALEAIIMPPAAPVA